MIKTNNRSVLFAPERFGGGEEKLEQLSEAGCAVKISRIYKCIIIAAHIEKDAVVFVNTYARSPSHILPQRFRLHFRRHQQFLWDSRGR